MTLFSSTAMSTVCESVQKESVLKWRKQETMLARLYAETMTMLARIEVILICTEKLSQ